MADPFGPNEGGDVLAGDVSGTLVDDWDTYHRYRGEVHCGTNAKRAIPATSWWE
jgi:protein-arginine deiminase